MSRRKIAWPRKLIYSIIPLLVLGLTIEGLLLLTGVRPVIEARDPYVGFSATVPLFEAIIVDGQPSLRTTESKLVWFNDQVFPLEKPARTKRVFCLGGSTTYGRPYSDPTSYVGWMRELLPVADGSVRWEVINAGGVSYASYRLATVMEELAQYEPDLFVIYSAHNEFLERRTYAGMFTQPQWWLGVQSLAARSRTFAVLDSWYQNIARSSQEDGSAPADVLPAEVDERLNHTVGPTDYQRDPEWQAKVIGHYRLNLQRMVRIARSAGSEIVFVAPASNERDCSPFKSEPGDGIPASQRARVNSLYEQADLAVLAADYPQAEEFLAAALAIDPYQADGHYRLGQVQFQLGQFAVAHESFLQAMEQDICPLRAVAGIRQAVFEVAQQYDVPVVDFGELLTEKSLREQGHACLGAEYFLDHVHPNTEIHRQLALWIIDSLQQSELVGGRSLATQELENEVADVVQRVTAGIDLQAHGVALRNLAKVLHWAGKFAEAAPRASDALDLLPGDPESRFVLADCQKNMGDLEGALNQYQLLYDLADSREGLYGRGLLGYAELLVELERYEPAKAYLLMAVLRAPDDAYTQYLLGKTHLALGEKQFAIECLKNANRLSPGNPPTEELLRQLGVTP